MCLSPSAESFSFVGALDTPLGYLSSISVQEAQHSSGLQQPTSSSMIVTLSLAHAHKCTRRYLSGIPIQEKQGDERWGSTPEYQAYKANTGMLLPKWSSLFGRGQRQQQGAGASSSFSPATERLLDRDGKDSGSDS